MVIAVMNVKTVQLESGLAVENLDLMLGYVTLRLFIAKRVSGPQVGFRKYNPHYLHSPVTSTHSLTFHYQAFETGSVYSNRSMRTRDLD